MTALADALADEIPETARIRLGRVIRRIVDNCLRHGDGSGEATARAAFDALADKLDPDQAVAHIEADNLLEAAAQQLEDERVRRVEAAALIAQAKIDLDKAERS